MRFVTTLLLFTLISLPVIAQTEGQGTTGKNTTDDPTEAAWLVWQNRQFETAALKATEILSGDPKNSSARHLRILASYLMGDYEASLADYRRLDPDYERHDELGRPMLDALSHLNRFDEAVDLARRLEMAEARITWMESRRARPMEVHLEATTILPFLEDAFLAGMMPSIPIRINGSDGTGHLDTGGSFVVMGTEKAASLGIETIQVSRGIANNQETRVFVGLADSLRLGTALLTNVPVTTVETLQGDLKDLMILGTNLLQQFLTTWDNQDGRLILTPAGSKHQRRHHLAEFAKDAQAIDFYMAGDHYLWASGAVGDTDVLYFVDSGLVTLDDKGVQPAAAVPGDLLEQWGYDVGVKLFVDSQEAIRLGPISRPSGSFNVSDLRNLSPWGGLRPDILLSFGFLKHFNWTLDFETHTWYFNPVKDGGSEATEGGPGRDMLLRYAGQYEMAPGMNLEVTVPDTRILLRAPGQQPVPMTWVDENVFEIKLAGATVRFELDGSNEVVALVLVQSGATTRAVKVFN